MNKTLLFFCLSTTSLVLSLIIACISPIITNYTAEIIPNRAPASLSTSYTFSFSDWKTLNCKFYADQENWDNVALDDIQKYKKMKTLCYRKKAMHDLEFACIIIDIALGFVCANLSLLHYLNVGKDFEKKTGIIGLVSGCIGFILTLVYVCYSGYIFNNDVAYGQMSYAGGLLSNGIKKLYSNGATRKNDGATTPNFIYIYENDKEDYAEFVKYKDLGQKQYNYDSKLYKTYSSSTTCKLSSETTCEYIYENTPYTTSENKDLYDKWLTSIIFAVIIVASNIGFAIFGFFLFKSSGDPNEIKEVPIA